MSGRKWYIKKFDFFFTFFVILICTISAKYQEEQVAPFYILHRHFVYLQSIKKVIFQGFMTKYLQGFEFKFQKTASYRHIFGHFLLTSAEELFCFTFLFMELLADYVGAIVSSFKLFGLVKLSLGLFIKNTSKSNWIPGLQTVWSLKLTSLKLLTSLFWNLRCIR